ncbi:MAG: saccharopine dehydrogenase family protein [Clostridium butyricum]|nr:saccharopine dehydrogenase family protein [Clostridium butyricum]
MGRALIIGAGGVASVAIHKCCQNSEVFEEICIASRTLSKCDALKEKLQGGKTKIQTAKVDADNVDELVALINDFKPDVVINLALPYQDLTIMDACLATKVHYVDTANYEPLDTAKFEYKWQWEYRERFEKAGITALLGSGFDPGVTGVFSAYAQKHYFDEIHYIDIVDANAGDHGYPFATNFNPEINIREITANGSYWEDGKWVETKPLELKEVYDLPQIGPKDVYLLHHEELESLGPRTKGKTNIGCIFQGIKDGQPKTYYVYNVCDHEECYKEVGSQAISYTTGVPAMIGASMILKGLWKKPGVHNIEEFDPDPFMEELNKWGLPWVEDFNPTLIK